MELIRYVKEEHDEAGRRSFWQFDDSQDNLAHESKGLIGLFSNVELDDTVVFVPGIIFNSFKKYDTGVIHAFSYAIQKKIEEVKEINGFEAVFDGNPRGNILGGYEYSPDCILRLNLPGHENGFPVITKTIQEGTKQNLVKAIQDNLEFVRKVEFR